MNRPLKITRTFLDYFVFYKFNKHKDKILGTRIRESVEELGLTFIKIGQILSSRYDLLKYTGKNFAIFK